jgi:hypothetical protein
VTALAAAGAAAAVALLTADTARVTAEATGTLAGGAGTLAAGDTGVPAGPGALAAGDAGVPAGAGVLAGGGVLAAGAPAAGPEGWLGAPGGWLGPLPGPGIRPWTALAAEPAAPTAEPAAALTAEPAALVIPPPAAAALPGALAGVPELVAAEARPATSSAKMSAAANPPHAYKKPLRTRIKARERVADPSTVQQATPDADNHECLRATEPRSTSGLAT